MKKKLLGLALMGSLALMSTSVSAKEHPLGKNFVINGMDIGGVYLQPITMDKAIGLPADKSDVHLEVDIHATKDNKNTFAEGWWIPYLTLNYTLSKLNNEGQVVKTQKGTLMPMIADDGPHYGRNVKLWGPGKYHIEYQILPPSMNKEVVFGRHIDKETAAPPWFKPFTVQWDFVYTGTGKKGGY